jgi:hypothetical protein
MQCGLRWLGNPPFIYGLLVGALHWGFDVLENAFEARSVHKSHGRLFPIEYLFSMQINRPEPRLL